MLSKKTHNSAFITHNSAKPQSLMPHTIDYILAPMASYTDLPFRRACRKFGLHYAHTALIDAGALVYADGENSLILARDEDEAYLAVQLLGSIPADLRKAAGLLSDMHFDAIDFNMGCPMKKVIKRRAGAALMKYPELAFECVKILRDCCPGKLTVKTRILSETDAEATLKLCLELEKIGIDALTIHARLPEKIYSGPPAWQIVKEIKANLQIPLCANGGIFSYTDAINARQESTCNRLMIARAAIGNPWIFKELMTGEKVQPTHEELCQVLFEHIYDIKNFYGEEKGMIISRKIIHGYLLGKGYKRTLRADAVKICNWNDFMSFYKIFQKESPSQVG